MKIEFKEIQEDHCWEIKVEGHNLFSCDDYQRARAIYGMAKEVFYLIIISLEHDNNLDLSDVENFLLNLGWFVNNWLEVEKGIVRYKGRAKK